MTVLSDRTNFIADTVDHTLPKPPYHSIDGLPTGLSGDAATGRITGTVSTAQSANVVANRDSTPEDIPTGSWPLMGNGTVDDTFAWNVHAEPTVYDRTDAEGDHVDSTIRPFAGEMPTPATNVVFSTLPPGLTGTSGGRVSGTVGSGAASSSPYNIRFSYDDVNGARRTTSFDWTVEDVIVHDGKHFKIKVPNYDGDGGISYLRMGIQDREDEDSFFSDVKEQALARKDGWYQYTSGDMTMEIGGNLWRIHHGSSTDYFYSEQFNFQSDSLYNFYNYNNFNSTVGMAGDVHVGGKYSAAAAIAVENNLAWKIEFGAGASYQAVIDANRVLSKSIEQEANDVIEFKVDPDDDGLEKFFETVVPGIGAFLATTAGGVGTVASISTDAGWAKAAAGIAYSTYGLAILAAASDWIRAAIGHDEPASRIKLDDRRVLIECEGFGATRDSSKIELKCGQASLILNHDGTIEIRNESAAIRLANDGKVTVRNADGGLGIDSGTLHVGHKKQTKFGVSTGSALGDEFKTIATKCIRYGVNSGAKFTHPKGGKAGSNQVNLWTS